MSHTHQHTTTVLTSGDINRSFTAGIALNSLYVVIEFFYGLKQNSTALLSDAVHNLGDISGLLLAFFAFKLMNVKSGKIFTYGLKKGTVLASFINSLLLVFAIGAIAWEGVQHILHPVSVSGNTIMMVAGIGVIINFLSAILFRKQQKSDLNIKAAYWHLMADALVSLGVVVSGIIIKYTDWYIVDGITAIIISLLIILSTWNLFKDSVVAILDGVPSNVNTTEIKEHLMKIPYVEDVYHIHIWSISTNENALTAHVKISSMEQLCQVKKEIKKELAEHNITHSTLEFESLKEKCHE